MEKIDLEKLRDQEAVFSRWFKDNQKCNRSKKGITILLLKTENFQKIQVSQKKHLAQKRIWQPVRILG